MLRSTLILCKIPVSGLLIFLFFPQWLACTWQSSYNTSGPFQSLVLCCSSDIRPSSSVHYSLFSWFSRKKKKITNLKPIPTKLASNFQSPACLQRDQQYASQRISFPWSLGLLGGLPGELRYMFLSEITACHRPQWLSSHAGANLPTSLDINKEWVLQGVDDLRASFPSGGGEKREISHLLHRRNSLCISGSCTLSHERETD